MPWLRRAFARLRYISASSAPEPFELLSIGVKVWSGGVFLVDPPLGDALALGALLWVAPAEVWGVLLIVMALTHVAALLWLPVPRGVAIRRAVLLFACMWWLMFGLSYAQSVGVGIRVGWAFAMSMSCAWAYVRLTPPSRGRAV